MHERLWTKDEFDVLVRLYTEGRSTADIAVALGRTTQAVTTKGSRIGLYGLTREELQHPGVKVRTCLNPVALHPFVSPGIHTRTCSACKKTEIFQAA